MRWMRRVALCVLAVPLVFFLAMLVGLLPANRDFRHTARGIDIFVISNGVHTDFVVPTVTDKMDWTTLLPADDFTGVKQPTSHVQFGWGDRDFCIETPYWSDVSVANALRAALWSSGTVMHVAYVGAPFESENCRRLSLNPDQYQRLAELLRDCFQLEANGAARRIPGAAYGTHDAFYAAIGSYHFLNTCNCWTGRNLRGAGVRCGIWTPTTVSVMWTLPKRPEAGDRRL